MSGNTALFRPFQDRAGFDSKVLGRFSSGEPLTVQLETPFLGAPQHPKIA
jgi:hypothetical protein